MIELSQIQIPNYRPLRTVEVEQLRTNALHQLETSNVVPFTEPKSVARDLLNNLVEDLCEILLDESCNDTQCFEEEVNRMLDAHYPWSNDDLAALVHQLRCYEDDLYVSEVKSWGDVFEVAIVQKMMNIIQSLLDFYCQSLDENFERLNESNLYLQRDQIREAIQAELVDVFPVRARMNADEAATWILSNVVGQKAEIALALLKDGRNLQEAVDVAKTFKN